MLTVSGVVQVSDTDFYSVVRSGSQIVCAVEFANARIPLPLFARKSVSVTGFWGMSKKVLPAPKQAVLARACVIAYPQLSLAISRGIIKYQKDGVEVDFSKNDQHSPLSVERRAWEKYYAEAVGNYLDPLAGL